MFTQLHAHGHYSLLEAIGSPKDYIAQAKELGLKAVCLTDYGGMYGCIEFYKAAKKEDLKPLLGVEVGLVHDITIEPTQKPSAHYDHTVVLIAQNLDGYQALMELVTRANTDGFYGTPRVDFSLLNTFGKNCIAIQGTSRSHIGQMILKNESLAKQKEILSLLQHACGEDSVYLEISTRDESENKGLKTVNDGIITLHKETNIPLIATNNVHYIHKDDKKPCGVALSIKDGKRVFDDDRRKISGDWHLIDEQETRTILQDRGYDHMLIEHCFASITQVIDTCTVELELNQLLFPKYQTPPEITTLYESVKDDLVST